jgi:hypothetical protein
VVRQLRLGRIGICAALHTDGRIETSCPDCGELIAVELHDGWPDDDSLLFHCFVPAANWWDDIVFTPSGMNLFRSEEHVARWLGERGSGATISVSKLAELAQAWWQDRLSPDWVPHTREENTGILERLGLTDEFWALP